MVVQLIFRSSPCENVLYCKSLDEALDKLKQQPHADIVENVWIIGGASVYQVRERFNSLV